jgi:hypothetical protein
LIGQGTANPQADAVAPTLSIAVTPEPASLGILALGGMSLLVRGRRKDEILNS